MPSKLIVDGAVVDDAWTLVGDDTQPLPEGDIIVPLSLWQSQAEQLCQRPALGIWLDADQPPELIADDLGRFALVAINFPAFTDGRGFSYARELRDNYGYTGQVRAIGAFMRDQLYYLRRCGFNAFALENTDLDAALESFRDFSVSYQAAVDQPEPLFRRR